MEPNGQKLVAFLPWVKLRSAVAIGNVTYVPFEVGRATPEQPLRGLETPFTRILSSYVDFIDRPVRSCVVVAKNDRNPPWNLVQEDFDNVQWCTSLLFLSTIAQNEYFQYLRRYVNRSMFDLYWQGFTEPVEFISVTVRRRDGELWNGGYKHGQVKFPTPIQADLGEPICPDLDFLRGLQAADAANSKLIARLRAALSFFSLANTESNAMLPEAEVILMASAFEQLLDAYGARELSQKFSELFSPFGSVTVNDALSSRSGIVLDSSYATAQLGWFVHRKWAEELYHLRNAYVHGESTSGRTWGWLRLEHLVVAAFTFPLAVKLGLREEGHYELTRDDEARCTALDPLLARTGWGEIETPNATVWQARLMEASRKLALDRAVSLYEDSMRGEETNPNKANQKP
jgi:hypothetical protein